MKQKVGKERECSRKCQNQESIKDVLSIKKENSNLPLSSLYLQCTALKLDPHLDACPPPAPPRPRQSVTHKLQDRPDVKPQSYDPPVSLGLLSRQTTCSGTAYDMSAATGPSSNAELSLPIVEVSGPTGPILVFRTWTTDDITAAAQHLPDPTASGQKFAEQFSIFCTEFRPTMTELKRLLVTTMKPVDLQHVTRRFLVNDLRVCNIDWNRADNAPYRDAVPALGVVFRDQFPTKVDMSKITSCRQQEGESTEEYLHHLTELFNIHSGLEQPADLAMLLVCGKHILATAF